MTFDEHTDFHTFKRKLFYEADVTASLIEAKFSHLTKHYEKLEDLNLEEREFVLSELVWMFDEGIKVYETLEKEIHPTEPGNDEIRSRIIEILHKIQERPHYDNRLLNEPIEYKKKYVEELYTDEQ